MSTRFDAEAILRQAASGDFPASGEVLLRLDDGWVFSDLNALIDARISNGGGGGGGSTTLPTPLGVHLTKGNQSAPNNIETTLTWDSETFDDGDFFDAGVDDTILTIPEDGIYLFAATAQMINISMTDGEFFDIYINVNSTRVGEFRLHGSTGQNTITSVSITTIQKLVEGDTVDISVLQNTGASQTISTGNTDCWFAATRIGR